MMRNSVSVLVLGFASLGMIACSPASVQPQVERPALARRGTVLPKVDVGCDLDSHVSDGGTTVMKCKKASDSTCKECTGTVEDGPNASIFHCVCAP